MDLKDRYESLLGRPIASSDSIPDALVVDTTDHLPYFRKVAKGNVLEIGVNVGNSTTAFLLGVKENGGHVYGIDLNPVCGATVTFKGDPDWTFLHGNSLSDYERLAAGLPKLDVLYVDGDHSYVGCKSDMVLYGKLVRKGGLILVHDVEHPQFPGVRQAFDEYPAKNKSIRSGSWGLGVIVVE